MTRKKLYAILLIACVAGYIWLFYGASRKNAIDVCIFKHATSVPCPSCGSTKSVLSLVDGNFSQALYFNPFGIVIASIMLITPFWIFFDIASKKKTLLSFYLRVETAFKTPKVAIPLVLVVLINWIWNITKYV